ncbi:putative origin of replication complex subunit 1 isoform X1 [Iris pallida]|uniref:Origin of replication complex subunit 1 isoform X1 n=1 Tax=Iris pallida TaxID=29817 RepID=A0AAX6E112_IRIPA|nr:putative origin of replication complex subunit 1 isoform X1 [Iris pallida]
MKSPVQKVLDDDWTYDFCMARREGKAVEMPRLPERKWVRRTAKERLLSCNSLGSAYYGEVERVEMRQHIGKDCNKVERVEISIAKPSFKARTKALAENEGEGLAKA